MDSLVSSSGRIDFSFCYLPSCHYGLRILQLHDHRRTLIYQVAQAKNGPIPAQNQFCLVIDGIPHPPSPLARCRTTTHGPARLHGRSTLRRLPSRSLRSASAVVACLGSVALHLRTIHAQRLQNAKNRMSKPNRHAKIGGLTALFNFFGETLHFCGASCVPLDALRRSPLQ